MSNQINIMIMVDSIKALLDQSLEGNCVMVDDSPFPSKNQGGSKLVTSCVPYQKIHWTVKAVDVQTPVSIKEISFSSNPSEPRNNDNENLDSLVWTGIVPRVGDHAVQYHYNLVLQIGKGEKSVLEIQTPALKILPAHY